MQIRPNLQSIELSLTPNLGENRRRVRLLLQVLQNATDDEPRYRLLRSDSAVFLDIIAIDGSLEVLAAAGFISLHPCWGSRKILVAPMSARPQLEAAVAALKTALLYAEKEITPTNSCRGPIGISSPSPTTRETRHLSAAPTTSTGALRVGSKIETCSLSDPALNSLPGTILSGLLHSGRQRVCLVLHDGSLKTADLKPQNLTALPYVLFPGDRVEIHSLISNGSFNGCSGEVLTAESAGRHHVRLALLDGTSKEVQLKPGNLRLAVSQTALITSDTLEAPRHLPPDLIDFWHELAANKRPAVRDVKYWGGADWPWRIGTTDAVIEDAAMVAEEELRKAAAEAEDAAAGWDAEMLRGRGIRVDWLLAMTFALNLWEWKTWEVVQVS